jgi:hypothetical protein
MIGQHVLFGKHRNPLVLLRRTQISAKCAIYGRLLAFTDHSTETAMASGPAAS